MKHFVALLLCMFSTMVCSQTYLSPNTLKSGILPGGYENLIFTLT